MVIAPTFLKDLRKKEQLPFQMIPRCFSDNSIKLSVSTACLYLQKEQENKWVNFQHHLKETRDPERKGEIQH